MKRSLFHVLGGAVSASAFFLDASVSPKKPQSLRLLLRRTSALCATLLLSLGLTFGLTSFAEARTFTVSPQYITADDGSYTVCRWDDNTKACTLSDAICKAARYGDASGNTIVFDVPTGHTERLRHQETLLIVSKGYSTGAGNPCSYSQPGPLTIDGGNRNVTIQGYRARVFEVLGATLTLNNLAIGGGSRRFPAKVEDGSYCAKYEKVRHYEESPWCLWGWCIGYWESDIKCVDVRYELQAQGLNIYNSGTLTLNNVTLLPLTKDPIVASEMDLFIEYFSLPLDTSIHNRGTLVVNNVNYSKKFAHTNSASHRTPENAGISNTGSLKVNQSNIPYISNTGIVEMKRSSMFEDGEHFIACNGNILNKDCISKIENNGGTFTVINSLLRDVQNKGSFISINSTFYNFYNVYSAERAVFTAFPGSRAEFTNSVLGNYGCSPDSASRITDKGGNIDNGRDYCGFTHPNSIAAMGGVRVTFSAGKIFVGEEITFGRGVQSGCSHPLVEGVDFDGGRRPATACTSGYQEYENGRGTFLFSVDVRGTGWGSVKSDLLDDFPYEGIDCGEYSHTYLGVINPKNRKCSGFFTEKNPPFTLSLIGQSWGNGSLWGGDCAVGGGDYKVNVKMDQERRCTATFGPIIDVSINEGGRVYTPGIVTNDFNYYCDKKSFGLNTGQFCRNFYYVGDDLKTEKEVIVRAISDPGYVFDYWEGDCAKDFRRLGVTDSEAVVKVGSSSPKCRAVFTKSEMLSVRIIRDDKHRSWMDNYPEWTPTIGNTTLDREGRNKYLGPSSCAGNNYTCVYDHHHGENVTLSAASGKGARYGDQYYTNLVFTGWGGDCAHGGMETKVTVHMDAAKFCTASYELRRYPLFYEISSVVALSRVLVPNALVTVPLGDIEVVNKQPHGNLPPPSGVWSYEVDETVPLKTAPRNNFSSYFGLEGASSTFAGWRDDCAAFGENLTGTITMDEPKRCSVKFTLGAVPRHTLTVDVTGDGSVSDTYSPQKIAGCSAAGGVCSAQYFDSAQITLIAEPGPNSTFAGWGEDCSEAPDSVMRTEGRIVGGYLRTAVVDMDAARHCTALFKPTGTAMFTYTVNVEDVGGSVSDNYEPRRIDTCTFAGGANCSGSYAEDSIVVLIPKADPGYHFANWSADCFEGFTPDKRTWPAIAIPANADRSCTATFKPEAGGATGVGVNKLAVKVFGAGGGVVNNIYNGAFYCTADSASCDRWLTEGIQVELTAMPEEGHAFVGWGGDCAAAGGALRARVTMDEPRNCTATFKPKLNVYVWAGSGSVSDNFVPPRIDACAPYSGICSAVFDPGTDVELKATPDAGYTFVGWAGDCWENGNADIARIRMGDVAHRCFVRFAPEGSTSHTLTVDVIGNGKGSVSDNFVPRKIDTCTSAGGANCSADYVEGTALVLKAEPGAGSIFAGWSGSGGCSAAGDSLTVEVEMGEDHHCIAVFVPANSTTHNVSVLVKNGCISDNFAQMVGCSGNGARTFMGNYVNGAILTLTAANPGGNMANWVFEGWGGDCAAFGDAETITILVNKPYNCTATFIPPGGWLTFTNLGFDIPASTVGTAISPINVFTGAGGGVPPYTFTATGLPTGIRISEAGVIYGTPTASAAAGTATITVADTQCLGWGCAPETASITIRYGAISAAGGGTPPLTFSNLGFIIPASTVGEAITSINVSPGVGGGKAPYTFSAVGLPAGIVISAAGVIYGTPTTPTAAGTATIIVVDGNGVTASIVIQYGVISPDGPLVKPPLTFDNLGFEIPPSIVGVPISPINVSVGVGGGRTLLYNAYSAFGLPPGIMINSVTGLISGAPTAAIPAGEATITVTDASIPPESKSIIIKYGAVLPMDLSIAHDVPGNLHIFPALNVGYTVANLTTLTVTVTNTGNVPTDVLGIVESNQVGQRPFLVSAADIRSIPVGQTGTFLVEPKTGHPAGTYTESYTIYHRDSLIPLLSFDVGFTVIAPGAALSFTHNPAFNVPASTVGVEIARINVFGGASGGTPPYTFSATGLPAGITISAAGVISGAPTTPTAAGTATITVTDDAGATADITINYGVILPLGMLTLAHDVAISPHIFTAQTVGYAPVTPLLVTVSNRDNVKTGALTVTLSGAGFTITDDGVDGNTIAAAGAGGPGTATFKIGPNHGLALGTYTATVEIEDAANGIAISFDVSFTVTPAGAVFGVSHDVPAGNHNFASAALGYGAQPSLTVEVTNTGNQATGDLTIALGGANSAAFTRSAISINSIAVGNKGAFMVTPITGLALGIYTATVTISNANVPAVSFNVRFEVTVAGGGVPVITHDVALSPHIFTAQAVGYAPVVPLRVTVSNSGNVNTGALAVKLAGAGFTITNDNVDGNTIAAAGAGGPGTATFEIGPNHGLALGAHTATVEIEDAANGITISFDVSFTVTPAGAVFGISHDVPAGNHNFGSQTVGYGAGAVTPLTVEVTNTGNQATGALNVALGGANPGSFTISNNNVGVGLGVGAAETFRVVPNHNLALGIYTATVTISNANVPAVSFNVRFEVTAAGGGAPVITHDVALSPHIFTAQAVGYAPVVPLRVTVSNSGNVNTGALAVKLAGAGFTITNDNVDGNTIAAAGAGGPGTATFEIGPNHGLALGAHTATVEIEDAANGITISFDVSFTVTPAGAVFGISHDVPAGSHNFASAALGYGVQPPLTVVVTNTGNQATGLLNIMRGGAMPTAFILSAPTINNIVVGGSASFTVTPVPGLVVGVYTATFTISNANVPAVSFNVRFEVTAAGGGAPVITTRALSNGRVGVAYNAILVASNAPTNWAVVGALPPGLALNPNTGAVSGTPTTAGVFSFDVTANNALGASAVATLSITIAPAAGGLGAAESIPTLGYGALLLLIALLGMGIAFHPGIRNRRGAS